MKELTGKRFGKLTVIKAIGETKAAANYWQCQCDCGKRVVKYGGDLIGGRATSCGSRKHRKSYKSGKEHGNTKHGGRCGEGDRLYWIWHNMKARCNLKTHPAYERYGGRGIKVAGEWQRDFATFKAWAIASGYTDKMTIDRINVDGDYGPKNCQWLTKSEHAKKTNTEKKRRRE